MSAFVKPIELTLDSPKLYRFFIWWMNLPGWFMGLIFIGLAVGAAFLATNLRASNELEEFIDPTAPEFQQFREVEQQFEQTAALAILIQSDHIYSVDFLQRVTKLGDTIRKLDYLEGTLHLYSKYRQLHLTSDSLGIQFNGMTRASMNSSILAQLAASEQRDISEVVASLQNDESALFWAERQGLINPERNVYVFWALMEIHEDFERATHAVVSEVRQVVESHLNEDESYTMVGAPIMQITNTGEIGKTIGINGPILALVFLLALTIYFRTWRYTVIILMLTGLTILIVLAIIAITAVFTFIMPIALVVAFTIPLINCIYIFREFRVFRHEGWTLHASVAAALSNKFKVILMANLTTMVGISTLIGGGDNGMVAFGWIGSAAIIVGTILTFLFMPFPMLLILRGDKSFARIRVGTTGTGLRQLTNRFATWISKHKIATLLLLAVWLTGLGLIVYQGREQEAEYNTINFLSERLQTIQDVQRADALMGGLAELALYIQFDPDTFELPKAMQALSEFEAAILRDDLATNILSLNQITQELYDTLDNSGRTMTPETQATMVSSLERIQEGLIEPYQNSETQTYFLSLRYPFEANNQLGKLEAQLYDLFEEIVSPMAPHAEMTATSFEIKQKIYMEDQFDFLVISFLVNVLLVYILLIILTRRPLTTLWALLCTVTAILSVLGVVNLLGWKIDLATSVVAQIVLGFSVDTIVHLVVSIKKSHETLDLPGAIGRGLATVIPPVMLSTVVLAAGFALFMASAQVPLARFGFAFTYAILLAMFANLFVFSAGWLLVGRRQPPKSAPPALGQPA